MTERNIFLLVVLAAIVVLSLLMYNGTRQHDAAGAPGTNIEANPG
ncbi:hypothetical protein [Ferirhizobium litorale]|nr:hypothetical protein [Fererhizobium litorale]